MWAEITSHQLGCYGIQTQDLDSLKLKKLSLFKKEGRVRITQEV